MTLAGVYFHQFTIAQYLEFCLRLLLAFVFGGFIGYERSNRFKEAGLRTHIIVCCTATLIMLVSKYGFADMGGAATMEYFGTKGADSARVAAQAGSGISFLCAGVIIKVGSNIKGLTTAAGIWMTASIGLAIGAGMYVVTGFTMVLLWVLQYVVYRMPIGADGYDGYRLKFVVSSDEDFEKTLRQQFKDWNAQVTESTISWKVSGLAEFDCVIRRAEEIEYSEIRKFVDDNKEIVSFSVSPLRAHLI